jgi:sulfoxide reductase heme-binding subunit YedZ
MRKTILPGLVVGTLLVLLLGAIGARLGLVAAPPRPDGPWMWVATRAAGVTALIALTLDVALGLALSTGALDAWLARSRTMELHRTLSATALALTAGHVLLLLADPFIRYDVLDAAVPGVSSYRPWAVAAGIGAAYLAVIIHVSFALRARIGARWWRRVHYGSFAVLVGALAHGITAGSDTGRTGMQMLYVILASVVGALVALRVVHAVSAPPATDP